MSERNVLALLANNRNAYEQYAAHLEDTDFSSVGRTVYGYIKEYYERDPEAESIDVHDVRDYLSRTLIDGGSTINGLLDWGEVSLPNVEEAVRQQQLKTRGFNLAEMLLIGDTEHKHLSAALEDYYSIYNNTYIHNTKKDTEEDILGLLSKLTSENKYSIYPKSLNDHLEGGLVKGDTVCVFARPEAGKSLFCINAAAGFCRDGHKVLYLGNEDPKAKMMQRVISRMSGMVKADVLDSPKKAIDIAHEKGLINLDFRHLTPGTVAEVDLLVKQTEPDIVIVDQALKLYVKGCEVGSIQAIRQIAPALRNVAIARDVIMIEVTQAGDSGDGKAELAMGDIEGTNTAMQADQDVIIGIGATEQMLKSGHRRFSFPKNKESGNHDSIPVRFEEAINKVHSI